jgi:Putative beta-barrel porin-2, OmpL-like. bbp2
MKTLSRSEEYVIATRRIAGTHAEKIEQLDEAIQELLDIKLLECAADQPNVHFLAVPRRSHWFSMTMAILMMLALLILLLGVRPAHAQAAAGNAPMPPVAAGIASAQAAQPAAAPADDIWSHVKFGATLEGYYQYDWNKPDDRVIPLRAYDTRANSFSIQQAALVVDVAPDADKGRRFGLRLDLQFGQATETVQGNPVNEPRPDAYRNIWQAYGSYVFPVGRGLQVDFGKFGSNLGYETNYAKDNITFSRAYLFNFLPFYHSGLRTTLPLSDKVTVMYMLTNGIQQTEDFNNFKSSHFTAIVKPVKAVTWTTSYFVGQEQPDGGQPGGPDGWFRVFDSNATIAATPALTLGLDVTHTTNQVRRGDPSLSLNGTGAYARYQVGSATALALRYERLDDEGLFGAISQVLQEATMTAEYKLAEGFLVRGEFRRDWSDRSFFPQRGASPSGHQNTALVGLVWWIGNKTGSW